MRRYEAIAYTSYLRAYSVIKETKYLGTYESQQMRY
jgi:hypothetical protein